MSEAGGTGEQTERQKTRTASTDADKNKENAGLPQQEGHGGWLEHLVRQPHVPATKAKATNRSKQHGKNGERRRPEGQTGRGRAGVPWQKQNRT